MGHHIINGIFLYTTFMLSHSKSKNLPNREHLVLYKDIAKMLIDNTPPNWTKIICIDGSIFYEDKSIKALNRLMLSRNHSFQKVNRWLSINLHLVVAKTSNFSRLFLSNGEVVKVSPSYRSRVRKSLLGIRDD